MKETAGVEKQNSKKGFKKDEQQAFYRESKICLYVHLKTFRCACREVDTKAPSTKIS